MASSPEAAAFDASVVRSVGALAEIAVGCALLIDGVVHFVSDEVPLTDVTWTLLSSALRSGATARQDTGAGAEMVVPLVADEETVGFVVARRHDGAFSSAEAALLRLMADTAAEAGVRGRAEHELTDLFSDYLSRDVAVQLLEDPEGGALGGRTMDVSVLFADLQGFTSLSEQIPPADVVDLLNRYFALVVPAITENGGAVSAFIGDAIMALFGAPIPHPEHPLLAARAAIALQDAVNGMIAAEPQMPKLRVGVATGPATVGSIGSPRRRVFTAIGDTVNLASRLESSAAPGTVSISAETYAVVRTFTHTERLDPIVLKGKAEPVLSYRLDGIRDNSDRLVGTGTVATPLSVLRQLPPKRDRPV
ncbi:adenylate/guanylate cyclase domain-containing protein [Euzebya pacifica]|uniref:adenylate/guanylate cyclase domain-containing protein n=1 Tax=Euzebya pacifica TaxID=1608957 RepID=UPI0030F52929